MIASHARLPHKGKGETVVPSKSEISQEERSACLISPVFFFSRFLGHFRAMISVCSLHLWLGLYDRNDDMKNMTLLIIFAGKMKY